MAHLFLADKLGAGMLHLLALSPPHKPEKAHRIGVF